MLNSLWRGLRATAGLQRSSIPAALQQARSTAMAPKRKVATPARQEGPDVLSAVTKASAAPAAKRRAPKRSQAAPAPAARQDELPSATAEPDTAPVGPQSGSADGAAAKSKTVKAPAKPRSTKPRASRPPSGPVFDASMRPAPLAAGGFKVLSWNVAGLRALLKKDPTAISRLVEVEQPDVLCLQEHKLQQTLVADVELQLGLPEGWHCSWNCSRDKKGYSGVALLSRVAPLSVSQGLDITDHDGEGRIITAEYPWGFVVNAYVPNSGEGLKRLEYRVGSWDPALAAYLHHLQLRKPVLLTGDLNVAPQEIDIHSPKTNLKSAGFTPEERESFSKQLLGVAGLVDTFRQQYPDVVAYTYWGYRFNARANNKGWRLDHFLASSSLVQEERVHETYHLPDVTGSDHCPLGIVLKNLS